MKTVPPPSLTIDFEQHPVTIRYGRFHAVVFSCAWIGFGVAVALTLWFFRADISGFKTGALLALGLFTLIYAAGLHSMVNQLRDAGKVALFLDESGVKFDRYEHICWSDINSVYMVENSDSSPCLWLEIREGTSFLPDGPRAALWLARTSGLDRCIDVSGYGNLSMRDTAIQELLQAGMRVYTEGGKSR